MDDVSYLDELLLDQNDQLAIRDAALYKTIPNEHLVIYGHNKGIYGFHTWELVNWLKDNFPLNKAIEIGAGNGALGTALNIPITDNKLQMIKSIKELYKIKNESIIIYPKKVIRMEATWAIKKYNPQIVIASWVTHKFDPMCHHKGGNVWGVDEEWIINNVDIYIHIGNKIVHKNKPILKVPHVEHYFNWLYSRSMYQDKNFIGIWNIKNGIWRKEKDIWKKGKRLEKI